MRTPIVDFVKAYADADVSRFHMPGHKGRAMLGCEPYDITEIKGADVLSDADGVIAESEAYASALFGARSFYSTEGSTLCIKTMLALVASESKRQTRPLILAARNVHKAFVYACALLDLRVEWLDPATPAHLCACPITARDVEKALDAMQEKPAAVYLTSPDYLGNLADVEGIAKVCRARSIPLLIDNAHGAYLRFLEPSQHPISLGATMCCDSAHKTLPVLTGGAYLHLSPDAPFDAQTVRRRMALFASTSPSYLILQSLDLCNRYLSENYPARLSACIERLEKVKRMLVACGFPSEQTEPLKLVLHASRFGYTGEELAEHLRQYAVEAEFADREYLVLMATPETREEDFARVERAFGALSPRTVLNAGFPTDALAAEREVCLSIREAVMSPSESVAIDSAIGRVCASPTVSCPPAVPVVISGERITENTVRLLQYYGIHSVEVVK
ncbi:MAG: amino acid decarboxylase [Clostridia bacterium]|nr:amino acid decarboxylase [Clostridia bacterium]